MEIDKMTTDNEENNITITPNDLVVIRQVIDAATQAGIFKAGDLTTVGQVFDKVNMIVEDLIAQSKANQEENSEETPEE